MKFIRFFVNRARPERNRAVVPFRDTDFQK